MLQKLVLWLFLVLMSVFTLTSCGLFKPSGVKAHQKLEQKLEKDAEKGYEKDVKAHYKSQSKASQRMIKRWSEKIKNGRKRQKKKPLMQQNTRFFFCFHGFFLGIVLLLLVASHIFGQTANSSLYLIGFYQKTFALRKA